MERSFGLRLARKGGHAASRWEGGTLICQYGNGVVLPIVEQAWRRDFRLWEKVGLCELHAGDAESCAGRPGRGEMHV